MWWLLACGGGPSGLDVLNGPGVEVGLPRGFTEIPAEELASRLGATRQRAPGQVHALVAARRTGGPVEVQAQRSIALDAAKHGGTVAAVLDAVADDLGAQAHGLASGAAVSDVVRDGGREVCSSVRVADQVARSCALAVVDGDQRLVVRAVTCTGPDADACEAPLDARRYDDLGALPVDVALGAPLPEGGREIWGFALGQARAAFQAACRAAGHRVDAFDWSQEPAAVRQWVAARRASRCGGLPRSPRLGQVTEVSAVFRDDQLYGLTVFLDADPNEVEAVLAERYPLAVAGEQQILHVIDQQAPVGDLESVTLFSTSVRGARASVSFLARESP